MPNDQRMREMVQRFGLKVRCALCGWQGRHRPETQGRLRLRACPSCGAVGYALRSERWMQKKAASEGWILPPHEA